MSPAEQEAAAFLLDRVTAREGWSLPEDKAIVSKETAASAIVAYAAARYPATSLETAACAWEAVLDLEQACPGGERTEQECEIGEAIRACRTDLGSSHLRLTVLGWVDAIDAAWRQVDTDFGREPRGGAYDKAFDWDFVPAWIIANVDWTGSDAPSLRVIA